MQRTNDRWRPFITQELLDAHRRTTDDGIHWWPVQMLYPFDEAIADELEELCHLAIDIGVMDTPPMPGSQTKLLRELIRVAGRLGVDPRDFHIQHQNFAETMFWGSLSHFEKNDQGQWIWKSWSGLPQIELLDGGQNENPFGI